MNFFEWIFAILVWITLGEGLSNINKAIKEGNEILREKDYKERTRKDENDGN